MDPLCTITVDNKKFGSITPLETGGHVLVIDGLTGPKRLFGNKLDNKTVDERLRNLSSNDYIVTSHDEIIYKDRTYKLSLSLIHI